MSYVFKNGMFVFLILLVSMSQPVIGEEPTAQKLVQDADRYRGYLNESFTATLEVTSLVPEKDPRSNLMSLFVKDLDSLVKYEAPVRDKGKAMLFKHRELWFHVPRTKRLLRLTPTQRLLGDASNGDVAGTRFSNDYQATIVAQETLNGIVCFVLQLKAVNRKVTYDSLKYWISKQDHRPVRTDHFAISGKLLKTAEYVEFTPVEDDEFPKLAKIIIKNPLKPGKQTIMVYRNWKKVSLSDSIFQKSYLKRLR